MGAQGWLVDFGALPPEINSGRIYSGPGSAPMFAVANAWDGLAGELHSAAASYVPTAKRLKEPVQLDRLIECLQEQPDAVQHWTVDETGLDDLVAELTLKPGMHAVHVLDEEDEAVVPGQFGAT